MRAGLIALGGIAAAIGAYSLSHLIDGLAGAALFMFAILVGLVALGVAIAMAVPDPSHHAATTAFTRRNPSLGNSIGDPPREQSSRCKQCGRARALHGRVWVCARCDVGAPVRDNR
ncbi:MAG: hypothetical protein OES38_22860 [Gammaproteobacteria bacterium]|nr:hypothetical protein [Gammaproteobacteria bacterium]